MSVDPAIFREFSNASFPEEFDSRLPALYFIHSPHILLSRLEVIVNEHSSPQSSSGLDPRLAGLLSYLIPPLTGIIFLLAILLSFNAVAVLIRHRMQRPLS